jgi:hypothetical protein
MNKLAELLTQAATKSEYRNDATKTANEINRIKALVRGGQKVQVNMPAQTRLQVRTRRPAGVNVRNVLRQQEERERLQKIAHLPAEYEAELKKQGAYTKILGDPSIYEYLKKSDPIGLYQLEQEYASTKTTSGLPATPATDTKQDEIIRLLRGQLTAEQLLQSTPEFIGLSPAEKRTALQKLKLLPKPEQKNYALTFVNMNAADKKAVIDRFKEEVPLPLEAFNELDPNNLKKLKLPQLLILGNKYGFKGKATRAKLIAFLQKQELKVDETQAEEEAPEEAEEVQPEEVQQIIEEFPFAETQEASAEDLELNKAEQRRMQQLRKRLPALLRESRMDREQVERFLEQIEKSSSTDLGRLTNAVDRLEQLIQNQRLQEQQVKEQAEKKETTLAQLKKEVREKQAFGPLEKAAKAELTVSPEGDLISFRVSDQALAQALVENLQQDVPNLPKSEAQQHASNIIDSANIELAQQPLQPEQPGLEFQSETPEQKEERQAIVRELRRREELSEQSAKQYEAIAPGIAQRRKAFGDVEQPDIVETARLKRLQQQLKQLDEQQKQLGLDYFDTLNKDQLVQYAKNNHPDIKTPHSFKEENLRQKLKDVSAEGFKKLKSKSISGKGLSQYPIKAVAGALHKHYQKKVRNLRNIHERQTENQEYRTNLIKKARK